jgi:hypothetical protein
MISREQEIKINENVLKVVKAFLKTKGSMEEISEITEIPSSSVQRYLNDEVRIKSLLGKETYDEIVKIKEENKLKGLKKGGIISTSKNEPIRDENGHFIGNKKI